MNRKDRNHERRLPMQDPLDTPRDQREARESVERTNAERLTRERSTEGRRAKELRNNREKQR